MDPVTLAWIWGGVAAALVILEHVALPQWYPENWGILGTHALGTATLVGAVLGWGAATGTLTALGAPTLGAALAGGIAVAGGIALCRRRRPPLPLTGYAPVPFYIGGTLVCLAALWLTVPLALAASATHIILVGGLGTLLAYGVRWRTGGAAQRRVRDIFSKELPR